MSCSHTLGVVGEIIMKICENLAKLDANSVALFPRHTVE